MYKEPMGEITISLKKLPFYMEWPINQKLSKN